MARQAHRRRPWAALALGLAMLLSWLASPTPTRAWTRASVETANARLQLEPSGRARVELRLGVRVYGGWLSRFELSGLGDGVELDAQKPAWLLTDDGRELAAELTLDERGGAVVSFADKQHAPRRGLHELGLAYSTTLAPGPSAQPGAQFLSWSLPAWQVDLREADIWLQAPAGTSVVASDSDAAIVSERIEHGSRATVHLHRAQLPRTVAFGVELKLPGTRAQRVSAALPETASTRSAGPLWVSALLLGLCWLKRGAVLAACSRWGKRPLPLWPLSSRARAVAMLALGTAAALCYERRPELGLGLLALLITLGLDRGFIRSGEPRAQAEPGRAQQLLGSASWLDATTPLGLSLLGSAYAVAALRIALGGSPGLWLEALVLATPLWLTGTRLQMRDPPEQMPDPADRLRRAVATPRAPDRAA
jgi:hypothetical protein